jgi:hypothetical protein
LIIKKPAMPETEVGGGMDAKKRRFITFSRKAAFLCVALLKWPILIGLFLLRSAKPFSFIFLVYPGSDSDLEGYCPKWLAKSKLFFSKPAFGGIISNSACGRGLILVVPNTIEEMLRNKDKCCHKIYTWLLIIHWIVGTKAIALAGQAPGIFHRNGLNMSKPFVRGNKGTVFSVLSTINQVAKMKGLETGRFAIAIVGVGYVGDMLLSSLKNEGHVAFGIDIKCRRMGVVLPEGGQAYLKIVDMAVVLTPRGSDFLPYVQYLKPGSIVIDDTHPRINANNPDGIEFYKVALGIDGARFLPGLPGYKPEWLPGCTLEAMYSAKTGMFNGDEGVETFYYNAEKIGFSPLLVY